MTKNLTVCYELKGASLAAARALEAEVARAVRQAPPKNAGNLLEIQQSWQAFYQKLIARLGAENPQLLQATGLDAPALQIRQDAGAFARAYQVYPQIFASPEQTPRYFMYVPLAGDGAHFVPQDALLLDARQEKAAGALLFAGGWLGNAPLVDRAARGVAVPASANIDTPSLQFNRAAKPQGRVEQCFLAAGRSLAIVQDYETRLTQYNDAVTRAFDAVKAETEKLYPQILQALPAGSGLYTNLSRSDRTAPGADTGMAFSVRLEGSGEKVALPESRAFHTVPHHGDVAIVTRDDTEEGRTLKEVLHAVPARPSLADYPELRADFAPELSDIEKMVGLNGEVPMLVTQGHLKILRYHAAEGDHSSFVPPGARLFPAAAMAWLQQDEEDRRQGIEPPPLPPELAGFFSMPLHKLPGNKPV